MSKMTDKDIIKALECCVKAPYCNEKTDCPYKGIDDCVKKHTLDALDLINRQQAEIEKLNVELVGMRGACESYKMHYDNAKAEIERLNNNISAMATTLSNSARGTRAEAIKEFAERLRKQFKEDINDIQDKINRITDPDAMDGQYETISTFEYSLNCIDNIVKEMVGEGK